MFTITGYETKEDFNNYKAEVNYESEVESALQVHDDFEERNYWLVTTTNEDGKLVR